MLAHLLAIFADVWTWARHFCELAPAHGSGVQTAWILPAIAAVKMGYDALKGGGGDDPPAGPTPTQDAVGKGGERHATEAAGYKQMLMDERARAYRDAPKTTAAQAAAARVAPIERFEGATLDRQHDLEARKYQTGLMDALRLQAAGGGPSLATASMRAATDRNNAQAMGMAASMKGPQSALAGRQVALGAAGANQQAAQASAMMRMQEQLNAQGLLGQVSSGVRAQDIGAATTQAGFNQQGGLAGMAANNARMMANAGFQQQTGLANAGWQQQAGLANQSATLQQSSMDDEMRRQMLLAYGSQVEGDRQALLGLQEADRQQNNFAIGEANKKRGQNMALAGEGLKAGAAAAQALSDERAKTAIAPGESALQRFLQSVGTHAYEYKDPEADGAGAGRFVSPMAQELERTELGKGMVSTNADGLKTVDYGKGFGAMLAAESMHEKRIGALEAMLKRRTSGKAAA
jgi:hypothetical protein